jgi:hypothetical protein
VAQQIIICLGCCKRKFISEILPPQDYFEFYQNREASLDNDCRRNWTLTITLLGWAYDHVGWRFLSVKLRGSKLPTQ